MSSKLKVAFLGPEGTYTHQALDKFTWSGHKDFVEYGSFRDIFRALVESQVDQAVVPVENMLYGMVRENLDLLYQSKSFVQAEGQLKISHVLVGQEELVRKDYRCVASHNQALSQCSNYLAKNFPGLIWQETSSTVAGLQLAAQDRLVLGIGPRKAAEALGLKILADKIENGSLNVTRFWLLGHNLLVSPEHDRFSLAFGFYQDQPGSLYKSLGFFADCKINLTCITSRPWPGRFGRYIFHLDLQGNLHHQSSKLALDKLRKYADEVKVLGSYQASRS